MYAITKMRGMKERFPFTHTRTHTHKACNGKECNNTRHTFLQLAEGVAIMLILETE